MRDLTEDLVALDVFHGEFVVLALLIPKSQMIRPIRSNFGGCPGGRLDRGEQASEKGSDAERSELGILNANLVLLSLQPQIFHYLSFHSRVQIEIRA